MIYTFIIKNKSNDKKDDVIVIEQKQTKDDNIEIVENTFKELINATVSKSSNIKDYYYSQIVYYEKGILTNAEVEKEKKDFFKKWDVIDISYSNLVITFDSMEYNCVFDKTFDLHNKNDYAYYKGKVRSKINFGSVDNTYKVISESDLEVYSLEKTKTLSEFMVEFKTKVPQSRDYLLEHSETPLKVVILGYERKETALERYNEIALIVKSKYTVKNNKVSFYITDVNIDGQTNLEHYFYFNLDSNGVWKLFKIEFSGC